jgi:hypothetical protein
MFLLKVADQSRQYREALLTNWYDLVPRGRICVAQGKHAAPEPLQRQRFSKAASFIEYRKVEGAMATHSRSAVS